MTALLELDRRKGAVPLYVQVANLLRARIAGRGLGPGDRLESEPELTAELGVSRATVGKALERLLLDGVIVREQGRGTFVATPRMERPLPELTGFTEHVRSQGLNPGQRLLAYEQVVASPDDPLTGAFVEGTPLVVVRRLRLVDDRPAGIHRSALPTDLARRIGFTERRLRTRGASLYALFERRGVDLAAAEERITARTADAEEGSLLGVARGTALIHVLRFSRDAGGRLVEAVDARYLSSLYEYRIDLVRPTDGTRSRGEQDGKARALARGHGGGRLAGERLRRSR